MRNSKEWESSVNMAKLELSEQAERCDGLCSHAVPLAGAQQGNRNESASIINESMDSIDAKLLPTSAAREVQRIVGLDELEVAKLSRELEKCDEDLILILKLNPIWTGMYGQAAADEVLDQIAAWEMDNPKPPALHVN